MGGFSYHRRMKKLPSLPSLTLLLALLTWWVPLANAVEVPGLYQATQPVDSREDARQRTRAFAAGMREMLVRLTGHDDVLQNPEIQQALANPQSYVESWAYQTRPDPRTQEQRLFIDLAYFENSVQQLLTNAGVALWPQNRPQTLVWIIVKDETGAQILVNPAGGVGVNEWQALQNAATTRGLPLVLPHWDYEDQTTMLPESLWELDETALRTASVRYGFESLLAIRAERLPGGHFSGKALHIFRDHVHDKEVIDVAAPELLSAMVSMVTEELADNYAVKVTARGSSNAAVAGDAQVLLLSVDGVHGLDDYANVLHYVENLAGISDLQVREVSAGTLTFSLNAAGQVRQLVENLAIDRKLQSLGEPASEAGRMHLRYRWQTR
ncbi:MAG TPA: DUF2066 domain-containing protein [Candidatus Acidoferrum sp.]|nr:DUF2066 domain-containing protein [Candidatus Acidoferrum sp.]